MEFTKIQNYNVIKKIGEGGMGEVYLAKHISLPRYVVVKRLKIRTTNPKKSHVLNERTRREAHVQSQLNHPNIVAVYDYIEEDKEKFLIMEYVKGKDLKKIIREAKQPLPLLRALKILKQTLAGLQYAHTFTYFDANGNQCSGIVHRDIKPQNILVSETDEVKIGDFGIVKAQMDEERLTKVGACPGTPEYMSPEQVLGKNIDHRSDIYSLGITLYEMLTGRVPFEAGTDTTSQLQVMTCQVKKAPPAPASLFPTIPPALELICLRALNKSAAKRYQSCDEFLREIESFEQHYFNSSALPGGTLAGTNEDRTVIRAKDKSRVPEGKIPRKSKWPIIAYVTTLLGAIGLTIFLSYLYFEKMQKGPDEKIDPSLTPTQIEQNITPGSKKGTGKYPKKSGQKRDAKPQPKKNIYKPIAPPTDSSMLRPPDLVPDASRPDAQ